jgi:galactosylceramidase
MVLLLAILSVCTSLVAATTIDAPVANVQDLFGGGSCSDCHRFDGIGGISGGGATSRLLVDYPPEAQAEILDFLFKPNFGSSLHMLKVEIGGDSQSTDGSESSHMHARDDLDLDRGYEWWLLKEAKKRNPNILTYGLPWAFPRWLAEEEHNPFQHLDRITNYTLQWVKGAREKHGIEIDYLGIWNEAGTSRDYLIALRKVLDENGFDKVQLVSNDGQPQTLCPALVNDTEYAQDIDILGFHYPNDNQPSMWKICNSFQTPIWAAEESSSYNDLNGAACWARVMASHYVINNMTANIMWNLVGSYMHGTNWYAASMLTATQPWSGYYEWEQMPVVWATAHYTQFIQPGWLFLPVGQGSGELANGGYYLTLVSPDLRYFTVIVVKISRDHAACTRPKLWDWDTDDEVFNLTIHLPPSTSSGTYADGEVQTWYSNLEKANTVLFKKLDQAYNGLSKTDTRTTKAGLRSYSILLNVTVGSLFTITNQGPEVGNKGKAQVRHNSNPRLPLPYYDDFSSYDCINCYSRYLSDQMGAFEIQFVDDDPDVSTSNSKSRALVQMAPALPIGWFSNSARGPVTLIGMTEWEDILVEASFRLSDPATFACVSTRTDQHWGRGISFCVNSTQWNVVYGGAPLEGFDTSNVIAVGTITNGSSFTSKWHVLSLETNGCEAKASINGHIKTADNLTIRVGDSGLVALGASSYTSVQFRSLKISPVGSRWSPPASRVPTTLEPWSIVTRACTPNGLSSENERFEVTSNWQIRHISSGLCLAVKESVSDGKSSSIANPEISLTLEECLHNHGPQQFRHDYTQLRNGVNLKSMTNAKGDLCATRDGRVSLTTSKAAGVGMSDSKVFCLGSDDAFAVWTLYPNTQQLRNSFGYNTWLGGRAQCLHALQGNELQVPVEAPYEARLASFY